MNRPELLGNLGWTGTLDASVGIWPDHGPLPPGTEFGPTIVSAQGLANFLLRDINSAYVTAPTSGAIVQIPRFEVKPEACPAPQSCGVPPQDFCWNVQCPPHGYPMDLGPGIGQACVIAGNDGFSVMKGV